MLYDGQRLVEALLRPEGFACQQTSKGWDLLHQNGVRLHVVMDPKQPDRAHVAVPVHALKHPATFTAFVPTFSPTLVRIATLTLGPASLVAQIDAQIGGLAWRRLRALSHVVAAHFDIPHGIWENHGNPYWGPSRIRLDGTSVDVWGFLHTHGLQGMEEEGLFKIPDTLFLKPYPSAHEKMKAAEEIEWVRTHIQMENHSPL